MALAGAGRSEKVDDLAALDEAELGECQDAVAVERGLEGEVEAGERLDGGEPAHAQGRLDPAVLAQGEFLRQQNVDGLEGCNLALFEPAHDMVERFEGARHLVAQGDFPVSAVCSALDVARSNVAERAGGRPQQRRGRPPHPDEALVAEIKAVIGDMPSYGYRRVHAILRRKGREIGAPAPNHKRVDRVMKAHGLLLQRHAGGADQRRHDGRVAVAASNLRWCSDGFEIGCDNGKKVRVAFALDCCDREQIGHIATTEGIKGEDVQDLMIAAVERRFGQVNRLPQAIEWLSDNGSGFVATETKRLARDIGLEPRTTPVHSPQSNGMAEAFVRTIKRDYVRPSPLPDAKTVMQELPNWFEHYNTVHPHKALGYLTTRVHRLPSTQMILSDHSGATTGGVAGLRRHALSSDIRNCPLCVMRN